MKLKKGGGGRVENDSEAGILKLSDFWIRDFRDNTVFLNQCYWLTFKHFHLIFSFNITKPRKIINKLWFCYQAHSKVYYFLRNHRKLQYFKILRFEKKKKTTTIERKLIQNHFLFYTHLKTSTGSYRNFPTL